MKSDKMLTMMIELIERDIEYYNKEIYKCRFWMIFKKMRLRGMINGYNNVLAYYSDAEKLVKNFKSYR